MNETNTEQRPSEGTLAVIYEEIASDLAGQHVYIEHLNQRAQQLFSFNTAIVALLAAVVPTKLGDGTKIAFVLATPLFALSAYFSAQAWDFRKWRFDPDVANLWDRYRLQSEEHIRHQVIQNRLASIAGNQDSITKKLRQIKKGQLWLQVGFLYALILLVYRVAFG